MESRGAAMDLRRVAPSPAKNMQPEFLLRFAPAGPGLVMALVYARRQRDVYGWYTGARDRTFPTAFFALHDYLPRNPQPVLAHSMGEDLYGAWLRYDPGHAPRRVHSPLPEVTARDLERLHAIFASDWLFASGDADAACQVAAYERLGLALHAINIRPRCFDRFVRDRPIWVARSTEFDVRVLECVAPHWALDDPGVPVAA